MSNSSTDPLYKQKIAGIFDQSSPRYGEDCNAFFSYFAEQLVRPVQIPVTAQVLDIATGRGAVVKSLLNRNDFNGKITGIDFSLKMIEETTKEMNTRQINNVQLLQMDAENLSFPDNTFDYIFCGFGIFFLPNIDQALKGILRVLKPGGRFAMSTWREKDFCQQAFKSTAAKFGVDQKITLYDFDKEPFIRELLAKAGFTQIQVVPDEYIQVYPTLEDWFTSLWFHGSRGVMERLTPEQLTELKKSLKNQLESHMKSDGLHEKLKAYYTYSSKRV